MFIVEGIVAKREGCSLILLTPDGETKKHTFANWQTAQRNLEIYKDEFIGIDVNGTIHTQARKHP